MCRIIFAKSNYRRLDLKRGRKMAAAAVGSSSIVQRRFYNSGWKPRRRRRMRRKELLFRQVPDFPFFTIPSLHPHSVVSRGVPSLAPSSTTKREERGGETPPSFLSASSWVRYLTNINTTTLHRRYFLLRLYINFEIISSISVANPLPVGIHRRRMAELCATPV